MEKKFDIGDRRYFLQAEDMEEIVLAITSYVDGEELPHYTATINKNDRSVRGYVLIAWSVMEISLSQWEKEEALQAFDAFRDIEG